MKYRITGVAQSLVCIALVTGPVIAHCQDAGTAPSAQTASGKLLFEKNCVVCHKTDGSGGVQLGDVKSADLDSPGLENQYHHDSKLLERAILDGKDEEGGDLESVMPRWRGRLTPGQVTDIIAYLKTLHTS